MELENIPEEDKPNNSHETESNLQKKQISLDAAKEMLPPDQVKKLNLVVALRPSNPQSDDLDGIHAELNWWLTIIWHRYQEPAGILDFKDFLALPDFNDQPTGFPVSETDSQYGKWLQKYGVSEEYEIRLLLATTMALSLNDSLFFALQELTKPKVISSMVGGIIDERSRCFLPSIQTVLYLLAGADLSNQARYQLYFRSKADILDKLGVELAPPNNRHSYSDSNDEWKNLLISLNPNIWQYFLGGNMPLPEENKDLPITKLETSLTFDDLVLNDEVKTSLTPLLNYARNGQAFFKDAEASGNFKSGYISLLQGPPGTGKTLIATTIGKEVGLVTYQLELAQVVSKYIGETSKNINKVFEELTRAIDHLKGEPSILFIDEADALIGKRSEVNDSKDRYANFDVSNLLQKIETFPGLIILASNFQQNLDSAIQRRIGSVVLVPPPEANERTQLWKNYKPENLEYPTDNFARILGERFRLTGAQINNIMKQVALSVYDTDVKVLDYVQHMEPAIKSELIKFNEVYARPRDFLNDVQVGEDVYLQQLIWERALPAKWRYNPLYMPRILSQAVSLPEADIKEMVKKVKRRWEGGPYHDIPFKEGIEVVLRDLCAVKNLNWNEIQAKIYKLLEDEKNGKTKDAPQTEASPDAEENKSGRTVQLIDLSKLKEMGKDKDTKKDNEAPADKKEDAKKLSKEEKAAQEKARKEAEAQAKKEAEEKKLKKILSASEAEGFWAKPLPQGFAFARKDMVKNMSQIYVLSKWSITKIVKEAAKLAKADEQHETKENGDIEINARHLQTAMDVVAAEIGKEIGKELDRDHFLRQDLKEQRAQEKAKEAKRRDFVPGWKSAPRYWAQAIPEGYAFERGDLPKNLAKFYPDVSVGTMEDLLLRATEFIGKDEPKLIAYSAHILKAIEQYGI